MEINTGKIRNFLCASLLLVGVTLHAQTNCASQPPGLVNWWRADGDATDSIGGQNGTVSGSVVYSAGEVGNAFAFVNGNVNFGTSAANFGQGNFTVEFWIKTTAQVTENYQVAVMEKRPACNSTLSFWGMRMGGTGTAGKLLVELSSDSATNHQSLVATRLLNDGTWHHVALTRANGTITLYLDGVPDNTNTIPAIVNLNNSVGFVVGQSVCSSSGANPFSGYMDELSIYNRALSAAEIQSIYNAGASGKCDGAAPFITHQPASLTTQTNSFVGFTVTATGTAPLSYQWNFDSTPISGATNSSFTIASVQTTDAGTYSVLVTNAFGSALSSNAVLTIGTSGDGGGGGGGGNTNCAIAGMIDWWPGEGDATDIVGTNNGTLSGGATFTNGMVGRAFSFPGGSSEVDFGTDVGNFGTNDFSMDFWIQTTSTANLQSCLEKHGICNAAKFWDIRIGNCNGCNNAGPGHIVFEIYGCPDYTSCGTWVPVTGATAINDGVWHHVACVRSGTNSLVYVDGNLDGTGSTYTGEVADVSNIYMCRAGQNTCQCCDGTVPFQGNLDELSFYNRALTLAEIQSIYYAGSAGKCVGNAAPTISVQPTNIYASVGSTVNVGVGAFGSHPLGYTWIFNGTPSYFTTNSPLMITNVQLSNAGTYYVVVTNAYGSATSSNAVLAVGYAPGISPQPQSQTALQFTPVVFSANVTNTGTVAYQWQRNGVNIAQATNSSFAIASVQTMDAASYRVVVTNQFGSLTSSNAVLTVFKPNVRLENAAMTLGPVTVPLRMVAGGDENSVSVSINWPSNNLVYASTTLGSNAVGALMTVNTNQVASGKLGIAVFFADSSNFGIGTQELARITFRPGIVTNAVTNVLTFGDVPVVRGVVDTNLNTLVTVYSNAVVTQPVTDYEGDVSPRTNGNHTMSIADWNQAGRFVAGLDVVSNTLEFLRADCAPRTNGGDGRLSIADWVQAGRYAFGFDPITPIGGPTNFTVAQTPKLPTRPVSLALLSQNGVTNTVTVHLTAQGDENALGFSLSYDPAQLGFVSATLGSGASGSVLNVNSSQAANGRVGIALALATGGNFSAGDIEVVRVTFVSTGFGASYNAGVNFGDLPILREIADASATTESASYSGTSFSATGQPLPQLTAMLDSVTNIVLSWPAPSTGFNLESVTPLGTNWTPVVYTPATNGASIVVTQAISVEQVFYRLRHP